MTPTSGSAPYLLSVVFANPEFIDQLHYSVSVRSSSQVGACPLIGTADSLSPTQINTLVTTGSVSTSPGVPAGSCRTFTLEVLRVSDNVVIDSSNAFVDNRM